jgi:hypothetical protein
MNFGRVVADPEIIPGFGDSFSGAADAGENSRGITANGIGW